MLLLLNECMQLQLKRYFTPLQLQISTYRRKSCITKVFKIHPLDTMNVLVIYQMVVELFQSGAKWWPNMIQLSTFWSQKHPVVK